MSVSAQELDTLKETYPNPQAYKAFAGLNLTTPQFISGNRANMFTTHEEHVVGTINPETPNYATSFEKPYGKYTDSYKIADADYLVVAAIPKYEKFPMFNYVYVVKNVKTNVYDIVYMQHYETLAENRGYLRPYTEADYFKPGQTIPKGTTMLRSESHDLYGNYRYGFNARVIGLSIPETEEDGILICKEFAEEHLSFYDFSIYFVPLNNNDILLNLYGDDNEYKCIPDLGEKIKNGILYAKRTINYQNATAELTNNALKHIFTSDSVCHGNGYIADIDVWINDPEQFLNSGNKSQIYKYYMEQMEYYQTIFNVLDPIVNTNKRSNWQYTHMLIDLYDQARNYLSKNTHFDENNNTFEFGMLKIVVYEKKTALDGFKITDRYGSKGVITHVRPRKYMPRDKFGNVADMVVSPPSCIARANVGQEYEPEYMFIADEVGKRIVNLWKSGKQEAAIKLLLEFFDYAQPNEAAKLREFIAKPNSVARVAEMMDDIEKHGIILIEEPFDGNISPENLMGLYTKFKIHPDKVIVAREFKDTTTFLPLGNNNVAQQQNIKNYAAEANSKLDNHLFVNGAEAFNGVTPFDKYIKPQQHKGYTEVPVTNMIGKTADGKIKVIEKLDEAAHTKLMAKLSDSVVNAYIDEESGLLIREFESENPVVIGKKYYVLLKQMPDEKFSARSMGNVNQLGIPTKSGKQSKQYTPFSTNPIRSGEMESDNLFTRLDPEIVHRYMATHSTNPALCEKLGEMLLTSDPFKLHDLDIKDEEICDDVPAIMFHTCMYMCGIEIHPIYEKDRIITD